MRFVTVAKTCTFLGRRELQVLEPAYTPWRLRLLPQLLSSLQFIYLPRVCTDGEDESLCGSELLSGCRCKPRPDMGFDASRIGGSYIWGARAYRQTSFSIVFGTNPIGRAAIKT